MAMGDNPIRVTNQHFEEIVFGGCKLHCLMGNLNDSLRQIDIEIARLKNGGVRRLIRAAQR